MGKHLKSFSGRLTRTIIIIVLVIMAIVSLLAFIVTATGLYTSFKRHFADAIAGMSQSITANLEKVEISAANIADEVSWHVSSPEDVISALGYEIEVNRNLTGCGVGFVPDYFPSKGRWFEPYASFTGDGPFVRDIGGASHDYHSSEWFTSGLTSGKGVWSKPYIDEDGAGTLLCTYSLPITDSLGRVVGVMGADLSLLWLMYLLHDIDVRENEINLMPAIFGKEELGIYSFILGPNGEYIAHPDRSRSLKGESFFDYADDSGNDKYRLLGESMCKGETGADAVKMDGRRYSVFFAPVSDSGWSMALAVPFMSLLGPALLFGSAILLIMLLGFMVLFGVSRRAIRRFTRPLVQLADSATEVAHGKFDAPLPVIESDDEIRLLRDSFGNMQQSLSKYIADLTETTAQKASIESELEVAKSIQMAMLPTTWPAFPDRNDIDIYGSLTPAKAVGGDLFDFFMRDGKLHFCIGDVSGKGIPASLVMSVISSMFRTLSASEDGPDKLVSAFNSSMAERNENMMFVTFFAGEIDLATGELRYCNAGHNPPFLLVDGKPQMLTTDANVPIGIVPGWKYSLQKITLSPGTALFLYTDGLTEATREDNTLFGEERVCDRLSRLKTTASSNEICAYMEDAVKEFVGDAEQSDDLTMLVIRVLLNHM